MTAEADFDLALELLAVNAARGKHWKFLAGMAVWIVQPDGGVERGRIVVGPGLTASDGWPDLTDPATVGCLLALVREAWGCPHLSVVGTPGDWRIDAEGGPVGIRDLHSYRSEAEALVLALEAAP